MKWISVEDRLPDMETPVLGVLDGWVCAAMRTDDGDSWYWALHHMGPIDEPGSYEDIDDYNITHWMPLPEPPGGM
jgi:hypothetical protein